MSDSKSYNDHPSKPKGVVAKTLNTISKILGILVISAVLSICIEWIGMTFFYPDEGYTHAESMMKQEMEYLSGSVSDDRLNEGAVTKAGDMVNNAVDYLFMDSGLMDGLISLKKVDPNDGDLVRTAKAWLAQYFDYLLAAIFVLTMFMVRMAILFLSIPAFVMFGLVGMSDGLMQRDLRRWCGGNESGFIYHWAKKFALPVLVIAWVIYLAIPSSIHPNFIITPFAVLFGLVLMVMSSKFKKYL